MDDVAAGARLGSRVELRFPGTPDYVRLARLAAADAASRAGLDVEEIEDLRIAVSELCAMVANEQADVVLVLRHDGDAVVIEGTGVTAVLDAENAEMARALVAAVVDEHDVVTEGDVTRFRIVKRRR